MSDPEKLALVIPVWNLRDDLGNLLDQAGRMGIFSQIIVSDDGSEPHCDPAQMGFSDERLGAELVYLRAPQQRGAGHARNVAFDAVSAGNVLFFDADDMLAEDLPGIWDQHLAADRPDFTIFRHSDTRVQTNENREGTFRVDEVRWDRALGDRTTAMITLAESTDLCAISAFPWNKIYRTDFLREQNITCSETPVHNDIRLHWLSFLRAERIQADRRIGAVHVVGDRAHHLTTRRGPERLCLDGIFEDVTAEIRAAPGRRILLRQFIHFVDNLCQWNMGQIDEELLPQFRQLTLRAYLRFRPEEFQLYADWTPRRAEEIVEFMLSQGG